MGGKGEAPLIPHVSEKGMGWHCPCRAQPAAEHTVLAFALQGAPSDQTTQLRVSSPAQLLLILFSLYPDDIQMAFVSFCLFKWIGSKHFFKS